MTNRIFSSLILATLVLAAVPSHLHGQAKPAMESHPSPEIAFEYTYVRSNAPPGDCDCFSLNGGSLSLAQPFRSPHFAAVFDATVSHTSSFTVNGSQTTSLRKPSLGKPNAASGPTVTYDLTLVALTGGIRYRPVPAHKWSPFGQILIGVANASGSLVEGDTPAAKDSTLNFASQVGGGLDYRIRRRFSIRVVEADYFLTTTSNGVNDHQNNLRLSTGIAFRLGRR